MDGKTTKGSRTRWRNFASGNISAKTPRRAVCGGLLRLRTLGLHGTYWGVIIPGIAFALPTTIIILTPFLRAIPAEIEEAAVIDGASRMQFFWRILLPLSKPGLITVGILAFVGSWNGYLLPLLVISTGSMPQEWWPLPLGVTQFSTQYSQNTGAVLAYTSLAMIPALDRDAEHFRQTCAVSVDVTAFDRTVLTGNSSSVRRRRIRWPHG